MYECSAIVDMVENITGNRWRARKGHGYRLSLWPNDGIYGDPAKWVRSTNRAREIGRQNTAMYVSYGNYRIIF